MKEIAKYYSGNKGDCFFVIKTIYKTDEGDYIKVIESNGWAGHSVKKYSFYRPQLDWLEYNDITTDLIEDIKKSYKDKIKDVYECKYFDRDDVIKVKKIDDFNLIYIYRVDDAGEDYDGEYILAKNIIGDYEEVIHYL